MKEKITSFLTGLLFLACAVWTIKILIAMVQSLKFGESMSQLIGIGVGLIATLVFLGGAFTFFSWMLGYPRHLNKK